MTAFLHNARVSECCPEGEGQEGLSEIPLSPPLSQPHLTQFFKKALEGIPSTSATSCLSLSRILRSRESREMVLKDHFGEVS